VKEQYLSDNIHVGREEGKKEKKKSTKQRERRDDKRRDLKDLVSSYWKKKLRKKERDVRHFKGYDRQMVVRRLLRPDRGQETKPRKRKMLGHSLDLSDEDLNSHRNATVERGWRGGWDRKVCPSWPDERGKSPRESKQPGSRDRMISAPDARTKLLKKKKGRGEGRNT